MGNMLFHAHQQFILFRWRFLEAKMRCPRNGWISWFHASFGLFFGLYLSAKFIWPNTWHVLVRFSVLSTSICTVIWCFSIIQSTWLFDQSTFNIHNIQIKHCHFFVNRITFNDLFLFECKPFRWRDKSIIIIKIDVGHLMRKLLFHDEFTNKTKNLQVKIELWSVWLTFYQCEQCYYFLVPLAFASFDSFFCVLDWTNIWVAITWFMNVYIHFVD